MSISTSIHTISKRYLLHEELGRGSMGTVHLATDRLTRKTVALKWVTTPVQELMFATRSGDTELGLALAQEFRVLASLRHPHIISVLDYGFDDQRQPYFTMDYLENARTVLEAGKGRSIADKIDLLVQLLQALAYLHRRNILHRDLKPGNVMTVNGNIKVVDFGLSLTKAHTIEIASETIAGTLAYLAPELLQESFPSKASDLYAVGVIAYEMLTGRHPFDASDISILINDIMNTPVDMSGLNVGEAVTEVLGRLLAKTRDGRYQDANEVVRDLCEAAGIPLPPETVEIRESFLQAAKFVGRETELARLSDGVAESMCGRGNTWLVGGESGVGKTRLLEELRTRALVQGALVLRGQSIAEGGAPYLLWRNALRHLCLQTDLSELEASVLKAIVPDIETLLGRAVSDAPELEPQATQNRLLAVIESVFRQQTQPVVVLLEDLHWARESLIVLAWLSRAGADISLMIVGSYRDDERPHLPDSLIDAKVLKLERLPRDNISELCESMLGTVGYQEQVVDLLTNETEGNVFFIVEVLRALAEEAGQLDRIVSMTLPQQVFSGGMKAVVHRRLNRVPENARSALVVAAIAGRQLDLDILRDILPQVDLDSWLATCTDAAVLGVQGGRWQFSHDKLRETLLADLSADESRELHRQVAGAIERVYPGIPEQNAALAYHWRIAGDSDKERFYTALAGEQALRNGAYQDAVAFLERTLTLVAEAETAGLGTETKLKKAALRRQLAEANYGLGNVSESGAQLEQALAVLGWPMPQTRRGLIVAILKQLALQALHRLWSSRFLGRARNREEVLEASRIGILLGESYYITKKTLPLLVVGFRTFNLAESAGVSPELAKTYAAMCVVVGGVAYLQFLADAYGRWGLETAQLLSNPLTHSFVFSRVGLYYSGIGRWAEADDFFEQAIAIAEQLGDYRFREEIGDFLANKAYSHSQFVRSKKVFTELYDTARRSDNKLHQSWGLSGIGKNALRLGQVDEAVSLLETSIGLFVNNEVGIEDSINLTKSYGILAAGYLYQGDLDMAAQTAWSAIQRLVSSPPTSFALRDGYAGVAEVYLTLWETGYSLLSDEDFPGLPAESRDIEKLAQQACAAMHVFARRFSIGQPQDCLYHGRLDWLRGHQKRAQKAWQKSLDIAVQSDMPYEQGRAHYEIGRHLDKSDLQRKEHLSQAAEIFERLEAGFDLERTLLALEDKV